MAPNTEYTLAEVTSILCPNCDEQESYRISRKIQNQANAGLIHPIKTSHTGRGVHRRYSQFELFKAKVLLEMEPYHAPNSVLKFIADLFDDSNPDRSSPLSRDSTSRKNAKKRLSQYMSDAINDEQTILLIVNADQSAGVQANLFTLSQLKPTWPSAIMLNLTEIFRKVK